MKAAVTAHDLITRFIVGLALVSVFLGNMTGLGAATSGEGVASTEDGVAKKSIFVDLGAATPNDISYRVQRICNEHRDPSTDNYIHNVVLVGIVDQATGTLREDELNAVLGHVPGGGGTTCFDNVFVGPTNLNGKGTPWKERSDFPAELEAWCADSAYCGGMLTGSWRWDNIRANRTATELFLEFINEKYPGVRSTVQWYITYEAYFDWLGDNGYSHRLKSAYESYLFQVIVDYSEALLAAGEPRATSARAVLWSPTYENHYDYHEQEELEVIRSSLRSMFTNINELAAAEGISRGLDWIHMQDRIGQTGCFTTSCYQGVKSWYDFLSTVNYEGFTFASLRVNMEGFSTGSPPLGDPVELMARQDYYEANGVPIGASWELTWWLNPIPPEPPSLLPPASMESNSIDIREHRRPSGLMWQ